MTPRFFALTVAVALAVTATVVGVSITKQKATEPHQEPQEPAAARKPQQQELQGTAPALAMETKPQQQELQGTAPALAMETKPQQQNEEPKKKQKKMSLTEGPITVSSFVDSLSANHSFKLTTPEGGSVEGTPFADRWLGVLKQFDPPYRFYLGTMPGGYKQELCVVLLQAGPEKNLVQVVISHDFDFGNPNAPCNNRNRLIELIENELLPGIEYRKHCRAEAAQIIGSGLKMRFGKALVVTHLFGKEIWTEITLDAPGTTEPTPATKPEPVPAPKLAPDNKPEILGQMANLPQPPIVKPESTPAPKPESVPKEKEDNIVQRDKQIELPKELKGKGVSAYQVWKDYYLAKKGYDVTNFPNKAADVVTLTKVPHTDKELYITGKFMWRTYQESGCFLKGNDKLNVITLPQGVIVLDFAKWKDDSFRKGLEEIKEGYWLTVKGKCKGIVIDKITVSDCEIVGFGKDEETHNKMAEDYFTKKKSKTDSVPLTTATTPQMPQTSVPKSPPKPEPVPATKPEPVPATKAVALLTLNTSPQKFDGQTITVRGDLSGTMYQGKGRFRLTLKGARTTADGEKTRSEGINFVIPNALKDKLLSDLASDKYYPVKLTVKIKQEADRWFAVVSEVEIESR